MTEDLPVQGVEVSFVGTPPVQWIEWASGVSEVEVDGPSCAAWSRAAFSRFLKLCAATRS